MNANTTADLMTTDVVTLTPRQHVASAVSMMQSARIRHLPVVGDDNQLLGLITQRDLLAIGDHLTRPVSEYMQSEIKTVSPDTPAYEAAYLLLRYDIGCVPVTDNHGILLGIITDTDFVRVAYRSLGGMVPVDQLEAEEREADLV